MTLKMNWFCNKEARAGLAELVKFDHFQPYPVLMERTKLPVAQFKWTVAVSKSRVILLAAGPAPNFALAKPSKEFADELKKLDEVRL